MRQAIEKQLESAEKKIIQAVQESREHNSCERKLGCKIDDMETKLCKEIGDRQRQLEASLRAQGDKTQDLKKLVENKQDKEAREKNIILHNIVECTADNAEERVEHDKAVFAKVVSALVGNQENVEVDKIFRLGKRPEGGSGSPSDRDSKPRLLLVRLKDKEPVDALIKRRTQLKDKGFPNVYLTRDLAPDEREVQKKLRAELVEKGKDSHMIFRGKVVPRR